MSQNPFHAAPGGQPDVIMDVEVAEPKMYQVLLHNDDYTTMAVSYTHLTLPTTERV